MKIRKRPTPSKRDAAVTIVLADDHAVVRQGLRSLLESDPQLVVVGEAANGLEAVEMVKRHKPFVLITDLMMPGKNGLATARTLLRMKSATRVILLSVYGDHAYVLEAFKNGAAAYVVKESCGAELLQAIRVVVAGGRYLSPTMSEASVGALPAIAGNPQRALGGWMETDEKLTAREQAVLQQAAEGTSAHDSGTRLKISPRKVEAHRTDLMRKLRLNTHEELIRYAVQRGVFRKGKPEPAGTRSADGPVRAHKSARRPSGEGRAGRS
jgi:two-component system, NarL family, response regulator NreC